MFLKIIMLFFITIFVHMSSAGATNNNHQNMRSLSHAIQLLKQPLYSLSKIAFCAFGIILILYSLRKFFTKGKNQQSNTKDLPLAIYQPPQPPIEVQIMLNPQPQEDLLNKKISFEIKKIKYTGTVWTIIDYDSQFNKPTNNLELLPTLKVAVDDEIKMIQDEKQPKTYFIGCNNPDESFSSKEKLLATNWSIIPEKLPHQPKFSLLPSCTLL